jgi:hypothetical protein
VRRSGWPNYLDALETYLQRASVAIDRGGSAEAPPALASRPIGPMPPQFAARAAELLASTDRIVESAAARRDEVLVARQVLGERRRVTRRVGHRVDWAL